MTPLGRLTAEDTSALTQLVDGYADAVDRRDASALLELFTPDGRLRVQAGRRSGGVVL